METHGGPDMWLSALSLSVWSVFLSWYSVEVHTGSSLKPVVWARKLLPRGPLSSGGEGIL